jgi:hypothetical protein
VQDISKGQRGFNRNIERLGNQLIQFYKEFYPRDYETTLADIDKREQDKIEAILNLEREAKRKIALE